MNRAEMLLTFSALFLRPDAEGWKDMTRKEFWADFLQTVSDALGDRACAPAFKRLNNPPAFEDARSFAAQHFVGGLPQSAMPVESLYALDESDSRGEALYWRDSATYMRDLAARLGVDIPDEFRACPDHIAVELQMAATLLASGMSAQAADFITTRFAWLERYAQRLSNLSCDASFYEAATHVIFRVASRWPLGDAKTYSNR